MRSLISVFILTVFLSLNVLAENIYKFGVFPHMPLKKLHSVFSTVTEDLQEELNRPIILMTKPYYKQYKDELNKGLYDFAFIQPLDYVQASQLQDYIPLARRAEDLKAIMIVQKASNYENIADIKDKVIAAAPAEAAVTQFISQLVVKCHVIVQYHDI